MRITHQFGTQNFKPGDMWRECDECGFDYLVSEMKTRYDGLLVCLKCYEPKHPLEDRITGEQN